uniref:Major facilitator superfamily (MFS) profile domain-containing protein n=1 Tax=Aotus nancymaae TaxID=37293 RepID=A0A2K5CGY3_AOTNA
MGRGEGGGCTLRPPIRQQPPIAAWSPSSSLFATTIGMPVEKRYNSILFGGLIGSAFSVLQLLAVPLTGATSDCLGRCPVMLLSLMGVATSYAVWATSGSFAAFLASRLIGGISKGNVSLSTAIIADLGSPLACSQGMPPTCCSSPASCQRCCPWRNGGSVVWRICSAPWPCCASPLWLLARTHLMETGSAACAAWA